MNRYESGAFGILDAVELWLSRLPADEARLLWLRTRPESIPTRTTNEEAAVHG